ncbi:MAG: nucleotidyltransferase [Deltaproteobacteria bacterium]|nr:nucleotidyltransferase [Deltaproteobacteria bacterium]
MKLPEDFKEFIELLNKHNVRYLIIGGYAISFYSRPKFTNDMDIWVDPTTENAKKVLQVLQDFGFGSLDITIADLTNPDTVIQLGYEPLRIDILTSISGINFREAFQERQKGKYFGVDVYLISLPHLRKNKRASGREKDIEDLKWLDKYSG